MKRYPLLIQLVLYFFLFILLLFGLIGGLYYQTSSGTIRQQTERTTRNSIDQSSQFITSYLKKFLAKSRLFANLHKTRVRIKKRFNT